MNRSIPALALIALLTANAAGAVTNPNDKFSPQTIGRQAVMLDNDNLVVDINATASAITVEDGKKEIDLIIGTKHGAFVQSQLGANKAFKKGLGEMNMIFTQLTPGDRNVHPTTAFRTVGVVDTSYRTRIGFSYKNISEEAEFVSLQGFIAMEQSGKFVALLSEDGSKVNYFDAEVLANAITNHDGDTKSLDTDALAALGVSESFSIDINANGGGRKLAKKVFDGGRKHILQVINGDGAIVASINEKHEVTLFDGATAPEEGYEVAQQSDMSNAKVRYNVTKDGAELAEPLEIAA